MNAFIHLSMLYITIYHYYYYYNYNLYITIVHLIYDNTSCKETALITKYLPDSSKHFEYDSNLAINSYFIEKKNQNGLGLEFNAMK